MAKTCIVVGSGMAGICAARELRAAGWDVEILDKGRALGGRMSTRRWDSGATFDHGAQYVSAKTEYFHGLIEEARNAAALKPWADGFAQADGTIKSGGGMRYVGTTGMRSIPTALALGLKIRQSTKITGIDQAITGGGIQVFDEQGARYRASAVILTPPAPQVLQLFVESEVEITKQEFLDLESVEYAPCLAVLAELDRPSAVPEPGGLWLDCKPIAWIADNTIKGISGQRHTVIIHAGPEFSRANIDREKRDAARLELLEAAQPWLGDATVLNHQVHGWLYSLATKTLPQPCMQLKNAPKIVVAGDSFGDMPRVEGAALSGKAAAEALISIL